MALSIAYKAIGPTTAISVANSLSTAVAVTANPAELFTHVGLLNTGSTVVSVSMYPLSQTGGAQAVSPTPTFPIAGTSTSTAISYILPASMTQPLVVPAPSSSNNGISVQAFGSAAGPSIIYVTPMTAQS